ncbi:hypothetical protein GCM10009646_38380 [Streptomyces aureus]
MRDDPVALDDHVDVLAHDSWRGGLLGRGPREAYRLGAQTVRGAASRCRCAHRYRFSPTPSHECATLARGYERSGPGGRVDVRARTSPGAPTSPILRDDREARGRAQLPQARYARYLLLARAPTPTYK